MNTPLKDIATIISAAIWADGVYAEEEKVAVGQIAEALELDEATFQSEVDAQVAAMADSEEDVAEALEKACENVTDEEAAIVIEAVMQILVCDGTLSRDEVNTLIAISEALGIETVDTVLLLCDMVKEEQDIEIDFE